MQVDEYTKVGIITFRLIGRSSDRLSKECIVLTGDYVKSMKVDGCQDTDNDTNRKHNCYKLLIWKSELN